MKSLEEEYINTNYTVKGKLTFENIDGVCVVNCDGDVEVKNREIRKLTNGFLWGEVKGNFDCSYCRTLKSLKGAPEKVMSFYCYNCDNLESLVGAPKEVSGFLIVHDVLVLNHLKGHQKKLKKTLVASNVVILKLLKEHLRKLVESLIIYKIETFIYI